MNKAKIIPAAVITMVIPLVMTSEGTKFIAYDDLAGVPTVCTGHTGSDVEIGRRYTAQECDAILSSDLMKHDAAIDPCIKKPMTSGQHAAFLSFAFNVGAGAFCGSGVLRKFNAADYSGACADLKKWVYASGQKWPGLVARREREYRLCMGAQK